MLCYSEEKNVFKYKDYFIEELFLCSVIISYSFISYLFRLYKLYISFNDSLLLKEYEGDVNMKVGSYIY